MRIGIVNPYALDVPGGVQLHVKGLAEHLLGEGHHVRVLAPSDEDAELPDYVDSAGKAVAVPYNGSVARLLFGPVTASRVGRWIERGKYDVLHVHEPFSPSLSMLAMMAGEGAVVGTFHSSTARSRVLLASMPLLEPHLEKLTGRIAVSREALRTIHRHEGGGDAVIIPNGVYVDRFAHARPRDEWRSAQGRPTVAFLGRLEEPRKGLAVLLAALPAVLDAFPGLRVLVAGPGDPTELCRDAQSRAVAACEFLGMVTDEDKERLLVSVDAYIAPNTGGESFGIILVEAMSAGAPVIASDLASFADVLEDGADGVLFHTEDAADLARCMVDVLDDAPLREMLSERGRLRSRAFDWSRVAADIVDVYETCVAAQAGPVTTSAQTKRPMRRLRGRF